MNFRHPSHSFRKRNAAFSLIEIVIALGVVGFAVVPMVGILPVGLSNFRSAADISVGTQISQRIINELQQSDFDVLTGGGGNLGGSFCKTVRYFDDQGNELATTQRTAALYEVNIRIMPATDLPASGTNPNLATATIQVANNPGGGPITMDSTQNLWGTTLGVSISTFFTVVSRNK